MKLESVIFFLISWFTSTVNRQTDRKTNFILFVELIT